MTLGRQRQKGCSRGAGTYNWADVTGATTGAGGADGAGQPVETVFAGSTSRAGRTLWERRGGECGRPTPAESSPPALTHVPVRNLMTAGHSPAARTLSPLLPLDAPFLAGGRGSARDLLLDRRGQKHQKDLVHQESPVQSEEQEEALSASCPASRTGGSTQGHPHPPGLTGGPGGPWRPEKPL